MPDPVKAVVTPQSNNGWFPLSFNVQSEKQVERTTSAGANGICEDFSNNHSLENLTVVIPEGFGQSKKTDVPVFQIKLGPRTSYKLDVQGDKQNYKTLIDPQDKSTKTYYDFNRDGIFDLVIEQNKPAEKSLSSGQGQ